MLVERISHLIIKEIALSWLNLSSIVIFLSSVNKKLEESLKLAVTNGSLHLPIASNPRSLQWIEKFAIVPTTIIIDEKTEELVTFANCRLCSIYWRNSSQHYSAESLFSLQGATLTSLHISTDSIPSPLLLTSFVSLISVELVFKDDKSTNQLLLYLSERCKSLKNICVKTSNHALNAEYIDVVGRILKNNANLEIFQALSFTYWPIEKDLILRTAPSFEYFSLLDLLPDLAEMDITVGDGKDMVLLKECAKRYASTLTHLSITRSKESSYWDGGAGDVEEICEQLEQFQKLASIYLWVNNGCFLQILGRLLLSIPHMQAVSNQDYRIDRGRHAVEIPWINQPDLKTILPLISEDLQRFLYSGRGHDSVLYIIDKLAATCTQLRTLALESPQYVNDSILRVIVDRNPQLVEMKLVHCATVTFVALKHILCTATMLQKLLFSGISVESCTEQDLVAIPVMLPQGNRLRDVDLAFQSLKGTSLPPVPFKFTAMFLQRCPLLDSFAVNHVIVKRTQLSLSLHCQHLDRLDHWETATIKTSLTSMLSEVRHSHIVELTLGFLPLTDQHLSFIADHLCSSLLCLSLQSCRDVTHKGLFYLISRIPYLENFTVLACAQLKAATAAEWHAALFRDRGRRTKKLYVTTEWLRYMRHVNQVELFKPFPGMEQVFAAIASNESLQCVRHMKLSNVCNSDLQCATIRFRSTLKSLDIHQASIDVQGLKALGALLFDTACITLMNCPNVDNRQVPVSNRGNRIAVDFSALNETEERMDKDGRDSEGCACM